MSEPVTAVPTAAPKTVRIRRVTAKPLPPPTAPLTEMTDAQRAEKLKQFYKAFAKNPKDNYYNSEGNLFLKGVKGAPDSTIVLRGFRPLTEEELGQLEEERLRACQQTEDEYEKARAELREAFAEYRSGTGSIDNYLSKNKRVQEMDTLLRVAAYPERYLRSEGRPEIRRVLFYDMYEVRKMPYDIKSIQRSEIPFSKLAGVYLAPGERVPDIVAPMEGGGQETLILSAEQGSPTRFFHPSHVKEFVLNNILFASPHQAFEYMRLTSLGNNELAQKLLGTRSSYTISALSKQDPRAISNPQEVWQQILTKFYASSPELLEQLKQTAGASIVLDSQKEPFWVTYTNALESVRNRLMESEEPILAAKDEAVNQSVISTAEQGKAREGAIIHQYKHRG
jgi:hypothetical protein